MRPLVFLAFANNVPAAHLALLKEERRGVRSTLLPAQSQGLIEVLYEPEIDVAGLPELMGTYRERVAIFHFGGHADGGQLFFDDEPAHAAGLARFLADQPGIQLVFLNGCSTQGQVAKLIELGVPLVIATSAPVDDRQAVDFSLIFYAELARRRSLGKAFRLAAAAWQMRHGGKAPAEIDVRGLDWEAEAAQHVPPWGLYVNEGAEEALQWRMPRAPHPLNPQTSAVLMALALHQEKVREDATDPRGEAVDERLFPEIIIKNFPWPIGAQLRILQTEEVFSAGEARLKQILSTYAVMLRLLIATLVSQLWEEKQLQPNLATEKVLPELMRPRAEVIARNPVPTLLNLREIFREAGLEPFIAEVEGLLEQLSETDSEVRQVCDRLHETVMAVVKKEIAADDWVERCEAAERDLAALQVALAFFARYQMVTIKNIDIQNPRHLPPKFLHEIGELNTYTLRRDRVEVRENFGDSHSILLVDPETDRKLNLSPFLIDKNAFLEKPIPHVFLYAFTESAVHHYVSVNHSLFKTLADPADQLTTDEDPFLDLDDQWEGVRRVLG